MEAVYIRSSSAACRRAFLGIHPERLNVANEERNFVEEENRDSSQADTSGHAENLRESLSSASRSVGTAFGRAKDRLTAAMIRREGKRSAAADEAVRQKAAKESKKEFVRLAKDAEKAIKRSARIHQALIEAELAFGALLAKPASSQAVDKAEKLIQVYAAMLNDSRSVLPPNVTSNCDMINEELMSALRKLRQSPTSRGEAWQLASQSVNSTIPSLRQNFEAELQYLRSLVAAVET